MLHTDAPSAQACSEVNLELKKSGKEKMRGLRMKDGGWNERRYFQSSIFHPRSFS
jgi:hypothetical protein